MKHKADEMEMAVNYKAMRLSWVFCVASLLSWVLYIYVRNKEFLFVPFSIVCIQAITFFISKLVITRKMVDNIYDHRKDAISHLISTIRDIMVIFISLIILIKASSIQSSDYIDYLDIEETPPEGSQYWVAAIIQNFIDTDIVRVSPCLKQFLKDNNRYSMQIE
jgi:hypothetical protein